MRVAVPVRLLALFPALLLSGCGIATIVATNHVTASLHGTAWGGNQTLGYSTIQLWAANNTAYGGASTPLINSPGKSDANGAFVITNTFTCPDANTPVYITATGGNPGLPGGSAVSNAGIVEMAALGPCGALSGNTHITLNEATTVAAIVALAPFFTAWDHLGSTATNVTGVANGMSMSNVLVSYDTGQSPGVVPANMTLPTARLYTLANILAACVNTDGTTSACTDLYAAATPPGGTSPTNVADAMINIAKYPANHVTNLYSISTASTPFQPTLASAPPDFTIAVTLSTTGTDNIRGLAFDVDGNAYEVDQTATRKYSPAGTLLATGQYGGYSVSVDTSGNVWTGTNASFNKYISTLASSTSYSFFGTTGGQIGPILWDAAGNMYAGCYNCSAFYKITPTSSPVTYSTFYTSPYPYIRSANVANTGNVWFGLSYSNYMSGTNSTGAVLSGFPRNCNYCGSGNNNGQKQVASDAAGNAWIAGYNLSKMAADGTLTTFTPINAGIFQANSLAIDGLGAAWVASTASYTNQNITGVLGAYNNDGTPITDNNGYVNENLLSPNAVTIDRTGNIWMTNQQNPSFTIFLGLAAPVMTPTASAVAAGKVGTRP